MRFVLNKSLYKMRVSRLFHFVVFLVAAPSTLVGGCHSLGRTRHLHLPVKVGGNTFLRKTGVTYQTTLFLTSEYHNMNTIKFSV
jgi:hypothetical protein